MLVFTLQIALLLLWPHVSSHRCRLLRKNRGLGVPVECMPSLRPPSQPLTPAGSSWHPTHPHPLGRRRPAATWRSRLCSGFQSPPPPPHPHPWLQMPYGNLAEQAVQRFGTYEDLEKHHVTIGRFPC